VITDSRASSPSRGREEQQSSRGSHHTDQGSVRHRPARYEQTVSLTTGCSDLDQVDAATSVMRSLYLFGGDAHSAKLIQRVEIELHGLPAFHSKLAAYPTDPSQWFSVGRDHSENLVGQMVPLSFSGGPIASVWPRFELRLEVPRESPFYVRWLVYFLDSLAPFSAFQVMTSGSMERLHNIHLPIIY